MDVKKNLGGPNLDESSLSGHFLGDLDGGGFVGLLDSLGDLLEHDLDVGGLRGVLSDTTVGTVGSAASGGSAVHLGVVQDAVVDVQSLGLGVGHGVEQQIAVDGRGLDGPSSLVTGGIDLLGHSLATDSSGVLDKGDDCLVGEDIVQVLEGLAGLHALGVVGDFSTVLVVDSQVRSASLGDLFGDIGFNAVSDHFCLFLFVFFLEEKAILKAGASLQAIDKIRNTEVRGGRIVRAVAGYRCY
mmetsp:Transcript_22314/g.52720  ORF Transcript_22314/g.52720 Transcript_22314/m.52720 type:complete len:242 (+) Transcript_22314:171-896(+)